MENKNSSLSFGLKCPEQLLVKLINDGKKIVPDYYWEDIFNFVVTAAVLNEWIVKYYKLLDEDLGRAIYAKTKVKYRDNKLYPDCAVSWFVDKSCFPNEHYDLLTQLDDCLLICHHVYNASKHFNWEYLEGKGITEITDDPEIKDYWQYFFTKTGPGVYVEYNDVYYCISQIRDILTQFYVGLIPYLENNIKR